MADPQTDQGFLPGLLGKVGNWFGSYDPQAEYGGLLSDDATKQQFRLRALGAVASSMAQNSMPVPYKGGMPWGSFLGAAGGAAATSGDSLIKARLEQAQQQQALANVGLSQQQVTLMQAALPGLKSLISTGQDRLSGGAGSGVAGTSGTAPTGPAKIIADSKGSVFDTGDPFLNLVAHHESGFRPNIGWGDTDLSGYKLNANGFPDWPGKPGPQGNSTAAGLFQITKTNWNSYAPPLIAAGVMKPDFSPESQIAVAKSMMAANGKSDWLPYNPALAAAYNRGDVVKVPGSAASPQTAGPPTATQPPAPTPQQTANGPPTGLLAPLPGGALPPGSEGATPGPQTGLLAPPPGAGPIPPTIARNSAGQPYQPIGPGGAVAAGTPGAGPVITPQQAAAANAGGGRGLPVMPSDYIFGTGKVAPPGAGTVSPDVAGPPPQAAPGPVGGLLSPNAAAIAQGMANAGGLQPSGSVAGSNAVPSGAPPVASPADAAAARAAAMGQEGGGLPGLLQQPPPAGATPTATPYTSAPPVTGQGAPAPGPAPTGPPVAPSLNLPPIPSQMPAMPNLPAVQPTPQQQIAQGVAGLMALSGHPAPPWIDDLAKMPAQMAMEQYKAWVGGQANMMTEQYKKQIEVAAAGTISYLQSQGQLPADLTKMTNEQNLKLRNSMAEKGLEQKPDGSWGFMPGYVEQQGQLKKQEQDLQQQREIAVKNAEQTAIAQREQQNRDATLAQLPLQERQKALFTDYADNVQKPAGTADTARKTLAALGNSLSNFQTGATAPQRLEIAKMWSDAVTTLGVTPSPAVRQMIASGETIGKEGNTLGFELAKELGSRESQMVIQAAIASNPGLAMSPQGNAQLIKLLDNGLQRDIAKKSFYDQYFTANHTYEGADTAFRKVNPVEVTVSSVPGLEYHPKTPQDIAQYPPGTRYMRPDIPGKVFTVPPNG